MNKSINYFINTSHCYLLYNAAHVILFSGIYYHIRKHRIVPEPGVIIVHSFICPAHSLQLHGLTDWQNIIKIFPKLIPL